MEICHNLKKPTDDPCSLEMPIKIKKKLGIILRIQYIIYIRYKVDVSLWSVFWVRLPLNTRLSAVSFSGSRKLHMDLLIARGLAPLLPYSRLSYIETELD